MVDYYRRPSFTMIFLVLAGMTNLSLLAYKPNVIPYRYLFIYGTFLRYLSDNYSLLLKIGTILAWLVHFGEATYVYILTANLEMSLKCRLYWFFQTFMLGYPSTQFILKYNKKRNN